jgi:hypothetical protein
LSSNSKKKSACKTGLLNLAFFPSLLTRFQPNLKALLLNKKYFLGATPEFA